MVKTKDAREVRGLDQQALIGALRDTLGDGLIGVALYGSRARGEGTPWSDWDVFLLADSLPEDKHERGRLLGESLYQQGIFNVSILALTKEEFEKDLHPIYVDIAWDAIILFDRDGYLEKKLDEINTIAREKGLYREKIDGEWVWAWKVWPEPGKWELNWR